MALVKCQRNSPNTIEVSEDETEDDEALNKSEKSECFFARKGTALVLALKDAVPHAGSERRLSTESLRSTNSTQSNNSDIHLHLQSMFNLLRNEETLKMAVKLESQRPNRTRYIVIASRCCFRPTAYQTSAERKNKILRHNSMRATTGLAAASATTSASSISSSGNTTTTTMRQLSMDSSNSNNNFNNNNSNNNNRLQQQQSQTVIALPTALNTTTNSSSSSHELMSISSSPNCRQSLRCDGDRSTATTIDITCSEEGGTEESCILGIDCNEITTIGLVVPILADTTIRLDGDGGFSVSGNNKTHIFKPVSVQAMWSALQTLHKVSKKARENNFYPSGPSHDWLSFYESRIESDQSCLNEWNAMDSLESRRPPSPDAIRNKPTAKEETESVIKMKLKEIMMSVDLDEVTSKYIRGRLEEHLDMDLGEYKSFIDQEMLTILGQMDAPTEIFDHVYLGSEWNASNLEELQKNGVRHILNVTREIDNFFPGMFDYFNVRVYDDEKTNLLKHWDNTFRYITRAKAEGSKVLVHCKMGVSRSASVVIAYAMKAYNWEFQKALQHVKQRRNCIKPNKNFLNQLETYRGMLDAMKNKEKLQRSKSETNLKSTKDARLLPGSEPTPLIQALNQSKTKLNATGEHVSNVCGIDVGVTAAVATTHPGGSGKIGGHVRIAVCTSDASILSTEQQRARQRGMRRSSSTSPKGSSSHVAIVCKQQSQSLENLTPERSAADEPKNVRFPGSNGENYSVTQNRVMHIQKHTPPPPPPPPPPAPPPHSTTTTTSQHSNSVRNIVQVLEVGGVCAGSERKTADDRKCLNLLFGRSVSHDTSDAGSAKMWKPQFDTITGSLRSSLRGPPHGAAGSNSRSRRKTQSWAASSGGIVMDVKLGSNSSIDSTSSCQSQASSLATRPTFYDLHTQRRELLPRHASWGSGDNRYRAFNNYDNNRNATNAPMPIIEGRTHELNMSNKTANITSSASINNSPHQQQHHHHHHLGTVNRTKQKLEESTQLKKRRQESEGDGDVLCGHAGDGGCGGGNIKKLPKATASATSSSITATAAVTIKRNSNLYRSSSTAATSARLRYPLRCNSDEIIATSPQQYSPSALRRSEISRPPPHVSDLYDSQTLTEYSVCDIENKNLPANNDDDDNDENVNADENEANVELRHACCSTEEQQRISSNVQILKKNFEAKAVVAPQQQQQQATSTTTLTVNTNEAQCKKGHQSLPSSPMAQHVDHHHSQQQQQTLTYVASVPTNAKTTTTTNASNNSSNSSNASSSSCSSSSSVSESCDRNVKGLVHKYQKTAPTTTTTATKTTASSNSNINTNIMHNRETAATNTTSTTTTTTLKPTRPRSCYEQNRRHDKSTAATTTSSSLLGKPHEFNDSRPPPSPAKPIVHHPHQQHHHQQQQQQQPTLAISCEGNSNQQQQQQQLQHRRLQQHGKTHPLARLSLQKHNINAAAYNTM